MPSTLDITIDAKSLRENPTASAEVLEVLKLIRPTWQKENIRAKDFTAGMSNTLIGYYDEGRFKEDVVLFRIHNEETKHMTDRTQEGKTMQKLNSVGFGVPLYAVFDNGLVHGYVQGELLSHNAMRDERIRKLIMEEMCRLHAAVPVSDPSDRSQWKKFGNHLYEISPQGFPSDPEKHKRFTEIIPTRRIIRQELDMLWEHLDGLHSPVVFCHNDLSHLNIIFNKEEDSVHFIDYEYAMLNYEHYEIGHHFCFMAGLKNDGIDLPNFPTREYQLRWIKDYLQCRAEVMKDSDSAFTDADVEVCYVMANKFALENMLILAIGGLVQARFSTGSFDFISFSKGMFDAYFSKKEEIVSLKMPSRT